MTEAEQIEYVKKDWGNIGYIENPSEAVQMAAVTANWLAFYFIKTLALKAKLRCLNYRWKSKDWL